MLLVLVLSCSSLEGGNPFSKVGTAGFSGIERLDAIGTSGAYLAAWKASPDSKTKLYKVFSRRYDGGSYDFTVPLANVQDTQYQTDDLRLQGRTCFVVRAETNSGTPDTNTRELCTKASSASDIFSGIASLERNVDASYSLTWSKIASKLVSYEIFKRAIDGEFDFNDALTSVNDAIYTTEVYPLGENYCFVVRYTGVNVVTDTNIKEQCTSEPLLGNFTGIESATSVNTGSVTVNWTLSSHSGVTQYNIYQDTNFTSLMTTVTAANASAVLTGLTPGGTYIFGVRAADSLGREDSNTKTMTVTAACNEVCNTPPANPTAPVLTLTGGGTSVLCTASYARTDANGYAVIPTFRFFNSKNTTTPRANLVLSAGTLSASYNLRTLAQAGSAAAADLTGDTMYCDVSVADEYTSSVSPPSAFLTLP